MLGSLNNSIMRLLLPFFRLQRGWNSSHRLPTQLGGGYRRLLSLCRFVSTSLWPYTSWYGLNAQFALAIHLGQVILKNRLGYVDSREHIGDQTDRQGNGKPLNRPRPEQKQKESGHHGRNVRIDNGEEGFVETRLNC